MSDTAIIICLSCGLPLFAVVAGFIGLMFTARMRATRELLRTTTVAISELKEGARVKVVGEAIAGEAGLISSRVSGRRALAYEISFRFVRGSTKRGPIPMGDGVTFSVKDGTGAVRVDSSKARLVLERDHQTELPEGDAPEWLFDALTRSGFAADRRHTDGRFILEEGVVEPGETVAVVGTVSRDASGAQILVATEEAELIISDDPGLHGATL